MKLVKAFTFLSAILVLFSACQANDQEGLTQDYTLEEFSILSADLNLPPSPFSYGSGNPASEIETDLEGPVVPAGQDLESLKVPGLF